jgi:hypothetical protein
MDAFRGFLGNDFVIQLFNQWSERVVQRVHTFDTWLLFPHVLVQHGQRGKLPFVSFGQLA